MYGSIFAGVCFLVQGCCSVQITEKDVPQETIAVVTTDTSRECKTQAIVIVDKNSMPESPLGADKQQEKITTTQKNHDAPLNFKSTMADDAPRFTQMDHSEKN